MNADQILSRTFAEHEHLAPDPDAVLAGLHDRPRRTLPVAAAAGTVAVVVIGAAVLLRPDPVPPPLQAAARPPATAAPATRPLAVPDTITLAAGRLPAGTVTPSISSSSYGEQLRGYDIVRADGSTMSVLLGSRPGTALPTQNKRGVARDVTIAGRPGREWSVAGWYTGAVALPGGRIVTVDVTAFGTDGELAVPAAEVAAAGRDTLAHVRLDHRDRIRTTFTLTWIPAGTAVRAVSAETVGGTRYEVAAPTASPTGTVVHVEQSDGSWATGQQGKPRPPATPGRSVQGHRTWVIDTDAGPQLFVDGIRPGFSILLGPNAPLADLYQIADGIR